MTSISKRFWRRVDKSGGSDACWPWLNNLGVPYSYYGQLWIKGKLKQAHRIAYRLKKGKIPKGFCVLHSCDNPPCCNPKHLFLGTKQDNTDDMMKKGRGKPPLNGEYHRSAKLIEIQVKKIRYWFSKGWFSRHELADIFHVTPVAIGLILRRRTWKHVK